MAQNKVDSNNTGLSIAQESSLKVLPGTPIWYGFEPNSYSDFGADVSMIAREPIDPGRQNKKGTVSDLDASGGFSTDLTKSNLNWLMQGFFFADARELPSTTPLNTAKNLVTGILASDKSYNAASGLNVFAAKQLVVVEGSAFLANNGLKTVVSAVSGKLVVSETLVDEPTPSATLKITNVGYEFAAADINIAVTAGIPSLTATAADFTAMPAFIVGNWVYIGGDAAANRFANNVGYARIASVAAKNVMFDDTTFTPVTEAGTGKSIRVFAGTVIRNEKNPALIKRRSYSMERQLGVGDTAMQAEYVEGAVADEFSIKIPAAAKIEIDLTFVGCDVTYKTGDGADTIKSGTRVSALGESAFNTSSDIVRFKMAILDGSTSNPTPLFGYVDDLNINIANGNEGNKAVGTLGNFDITSGNFAVTGDVTAYFSTVSAIRAIRNNADVGVSAIAASRNSGFVLDIPLLSLGGGRADVEKDTPIKLPLDTMGAENKNGYTMLYVSYPYLPTIALAK